MTVQTTKEFQSGWDKNLIVPGSLNTALYSATDIYSKPQVYHQLTLLPTICFPIRLQQYPWTNTTFSIYLGISIKDPFGLISPDVYLIGPSAKTEKKKSSRARCLRVSCLEGG